MANVLDITGRRFERLIAIKDAGSDKHGKKLWLFQCDCGNTKITLATSVKNGKTRSCGCLAKELSAKRQRKDITGQRFGRLVALRDVGGKKTKSGVNRLWECQCDCGQKSTVPGTSLLSGNTTSCGCYGATRMVRQQRHDLTGQRVGNLTAVRFSHNITKKNGNKGQAYWVWRCDCGSELTASGTGVKNRFKKRGNVSCPSCAAKRRAAPRRLDLTGKRFGKLVALKQLNLEKSPALSPWLWQCDCGHTCERYFGNVRDNDNPNCGCDRKRTAADRTGERFGSLVALRSIGKRPGERTYTWEFQCDCGNLCEARLRDAVSGLQQSCGCRQGGYDSVAGWIDGDFRNAEDDAFFYVFPLARFDGYAKPGIAEDIDVRKRASRGEYGDVHDFIALPRIEAWLVEQAVLNATRLMAGCPAELSDRKWEGHTEVRKMEPEAVFELALELHQQLQEVGREKFAIQHIPMTPGEQKQLEKLAFDHT